MRRNVPWWAAALVLLALAAVMSGFVHVGRTRFGLLVCRKEAWSTSGTFDAGACVRRATGGDQ